MANSNEYMKNYMREYSAKKSRRPMTIWEENAHIAVLQVVLKYITRTQQKSHFLSVVLGIIHGRKLSQNLISVYFCANHATIMLIKLSMIMDTLESIGEVVGVQIVDLQMQNILNYIDKLMEDRFNSYLSTNQDAAGSIPARPTLLQQ